MMVILEGRFSAGYYLVFNVANIYGQIYVYMRMVFDITCCIRYLIFHIISAILPLPLKCFYYFCR